MVTGSIEFKCGEQGLFLNAMDAQSVWDALGDALDLMYDLNDEDHELYDSKKKLSIGAASDIFHNYFNNQLFIHELNDYNKCFEETHVFHNDVSDRVSVYHISDCTSGYRNYEYIYADGELVAIIPDSTVQETIIERIAYHAEKAIEIKENENETSTSTITPD